MALNLNLWTSMSISGRILTDVTVRCEDIFALQSLYHHFLIKVYGKNLPIGAWAELSFLNVKAQLQVNDYLERELCTISLLLSILPDLE